MAMTAAAADTARTDTRSVGMAQTETGSAGRFGPYGGQFVPETLMPALKELTAAYEAIQQDETFNATLDDLLHHYVGRPTTLYHAERLSASIGGAQIWLKREDLAHTGAHKINSAVAQGLLAQRMGKPRIICETGAGQHGVATATVCAMLGLECVVYMGEVDIHRQALNVFRMKLLDAEVRTVTTGSKTLKDAINEAIRDWVTNVRTTHYLIGSVVGPHPYPTMVRDFQSVIGKEARAQCLERMGRLPQAVLACVGGGSNAIGIFHPFVGDTEVELIGVEAAGRGLDTGEYAASLTVGRPGVLHGSYSYLLQNEHGQVEEAHSISAGLDYPGVGPEHSLYRDTGRAQLRGGDRCRGHARRAAAFPEPRGIIPALEPAHAIYYAMQLARERDPADTLLGQSLRSRGQGHDHDCRRHRGLAVVTAGTRYNARAACTSRLAAADRTGWTEGQWQRIRHLRRHPGAQSRAAPLRPVRGCSYCLPAASAWLRWGSSTCCSFRTGWAPGRVSWGWAWSPLQWP